VELASGVEPVDQGDDPPERRHDPVEGPALLVMPDEPERDQRDQDEERGILLHQVQRVDVVLADRQDGVLQRQRQQPGAEEKDANPPEEEGNADEGVQRPGNGPQHGV